MTFACGTNAGYHRHRRARETPCAACRAAHATAARAERRRPRGDIRQIRVPADLLAALYLNSTVEQQEAAERHLGRPLLDQLVNALDRKAS
ncbi:hypothetical protein IU433_14260 [Nocardia puris]|uniref:hypothetical protein n=1 Tax=Nocardia puris TaxID=208602 RepID=UPI001895612B|nr:hypothetical protein [Nocardia puris]MBF6460201.1 hypothetical protein [Nocardia puris]